MKTDQPVTPVTVAGGVTDKMICKCPYYILRDGQLICNQCGKPSPARKIEDKLRRGIQNKC